MCFHVVSGLSHLIAETPCAVLCALSQVAHHPRKAGKSKYGLLRTPRVLFDLALVLFLKSFRDRPMQFFGLLAAVPLLISGGFLALFCSTALQTGPSYGWAMALSAGLPHLVATLEFLVASVLVRTAVLQKAGVRLCCSLVSGEVPEALGRFTTCISLGFASDRICPHPLPCVSHVWCLCACSSCVWAW